MKEVKKTKQNPPKKQNSHILSPPCERSLVNCNASTAGQPPTKSWLELAGKIPGGSTKRRFMGVVKDGMDGEEAAEGRVSPLGCEAGSGLRPHLSAVQRDRGLVSCVCASSLICSSSLLAQTPLNPGRALTRMMHSPSCPCAAHLLPLAGRRARDWRKVGTSVARSCFCRGRGGLQRWFGCQSGWRKQNVDTLAVP